MSAVVVAAAAAPSAVPVAPACETLPVCSETTPVGEREGGGGSVNRGLNACNVVDKRAGVGDVTTCVYKNIFL